MAETNAERAVRIKKEEAKKNRRKNWGYMQNKKTTTNRLDEAFNYQDRGIQKEVNKRNQNKVNSYTK